MNTLLTKYLDQLVLGPALPTGHAQVEGQFVVAAGGGVGHHADEGADVEFETGPRPEDAEDRLGGEVEEEVVVTPSGAAIISLPVEALSGG